MKLKKEHLARASRILERLNLDLLDMSIFMPIEMEEKHLDEFGMPSTKYKAETFYGNTLLPGIMSVNVDIIDKADDTKKYRHPFCVLAFAQTTELFTFNLSGFMDIIPQNFLNKEDKEFILQFESCLVKTDKAALTREFIKDIYPLENDQYSEEILNKDLIKQSESEKSENETFSDISNNDKYDA